MTDLLLTRRSIKKYSSRMPSDKDIRKITEAGLYAPSAMNRQMAKIIIIKNKELRDEIAKANASIMNRDFDPFYNAPVIMLVIAKRDWPTARHDGALVIGNMLLKAHELGLGACWIHRADEEMKMPIGKKIMEKIGLEGDYEGIGHMALGYPDCEYPKAAPRLEDRIFYLD